MVFASHKKGMDLLEIANYFGNYMTDEFSEEKKREDADMLMHNKKVFNQGLLLNFNLY